MKTKILVVDDNQRILFAMADSINTILEKAGIAEADVVTRLCPTAREAIEAVRQQRPNILFLDYHFGHHTTGREVAEWIDKHYGKPIQVATHANCSEEQARKLFTGTACVTHFMGTRLFEKLQNFLEAQL